MTSNGQRPFFTPVASLAEAMALIQAQPYVFVYISSPDCGVCHALKPQLSLLLADHQDSIDFIELDAQALPAVASQFHALTLPVLLLFIQGQERLRAARFVNTAQLKNDVARLIQAHRQA